MPELAEVEVGRKLAASVGQGRRIERAQCEDDAIVFEGTTPEQMRGALEGRTVVDVHRHGKHLWFELDARPWPLFHFGMTGAFRVPARDPLELESGIKDPPGQWPPRFTKIHLRFEDGGELVMTNARRLGRIRLRMDPETEPPLAGLGFDPYKNLPRRPNFVALVSRRKLPLKALLLDQSFAAGVGNWLADEILYQARLDPRRLAQGLSEAEAARLHAKMKAVVRHAVSVDADKSRFPKTWLFHQRWGKKAGTLRGHPIEHITIAGRTTAWVPNLQG